MKFLLNATYYILQQYNDDYYSCGPSSEMGKLIAGVCVCLFGIILTVAAGFLTKSSVDKLNDLESTIGIIVGRSLCSGSSGTGTTTSNSYSAVIEYFDEFNQETYTFTTSTCSSPGPKVGNEIKVLYDPENPGEAYNGSFMGLWLFPLIMGGVGAFLLIFAIVAGLKRFRNKPQESTTVEQAQSDPAYITSNTNQGPTLTLTPTATTSNYNNGASSPGTSNPYTSNSYTTSNTNQGPTTTASNNNTNSNTGTSIFDQLKS